MTTSLRQLDARSSRALRASQWLSSAAFACIAIPALLRWTIDLPGWVSVASAAGFVIGIAAWILLARQVRCPYCAGKLAYRFAPSWRKPPQVAGRGEVRCATCQEVARISGVG